MRYIFWRNCQNLHHSFLQAAAALWAGGVKTFCMVRKRFVHQHWPEAQEVKFPWVKGEIFTGESDEQPHGILSRRGRRSHSNLFKQPGEGCWREHRLLTRKSARGETAALSMLTAVGRGPKEGAQINAREGAAFLIFTCVNAVPATEAAQKTSVLVG